MAVVTDAGRLLPRVKRVVHSLEEVWPVVDPVPAGDVRDVELPGPFDDIRKHYISGPISGIWGGISQRTPIIVSQTLKITYGALSGLS
eukprot:COSAG05_NODE_715_length_7805_cov_5.098235_2_plen_88_part_00